MIDVVVTCAADSGSSGVDDTQNVRVIEGMWKRATEQDALADCIAV